MQATRVAGFFVSFFVSYLGWVQGAIVAGYVLVCFHILPSGAWMGSPGGSSDRGGRVYTKSVQRDLDTSKVCSAAQ